MTKEQADVVEYAEDIAAGLARKARAAGLDALAYFLDMAALEAGLAARARELGAPEAAAA